MLAEVDSIYYVTEYNIVSYREDPHLEEEETDTVTTEVTRGIVTNRTLKVSPYLSIYICVGLLKKRPYESDDEGAYESEGAINDYNDPSNKRGGKQNGGGYDSAEEIIKNKQSKICKM